MFDVEQLIQNQRAHQAQGGWARNDLALPPNMDDFIRETLTDFTVGDPKVRLLTMKGPTDVIHPENVVLVSRPANTRKQTWCYDGAGDKQWHASPQGYRDEISGIIERDLENLRTNKPEFSAYCFALWVPVYAISASTCGMQRLMIHYAKKVL